MTHAMFDVQATDHIWLVECVECDHRIVISRAVLATGSVVDAVAVIDYGDGSATHAWSSSPDLDAHIATGLISRG